jgi:dihydroflavonol-4-reductase
MGHVVVTGAGGFIGSSVARQLLERGRRVLAVVEPGADSRNLEGLNVERVVADICDLPAMTRILQGAEALYHLAALYRIHLPDPSIIYRVNIEGTTTTLLAAQKAAVPKVVYTASIAAVGQRDDGQPADETVAFNLHDIANEYILTKHLSERIALRFAEAGLPLVVVNPAFPFGERDLGPTPTGNILLTIARGEAPALPPGGFNAVDVDLVALGHILAEERGKIGERYILGDHNIRYVDFGRIVGEVLGMKVSRLTVPPQIGTPLAWLYEHYYERITSKPSPVTVKTSQYASRNIYYDCTKARRELGLPSRPLEESIRRAVAWFRQHGMLKAR